MSKFKPITNAMELKTLCEEDENNVGVTRSGEMYSFDFEKDKPQKINVEQAGEQLGLSFDIIAEVVKSGGHFEVPTPIEVEKKDPTPGDQEDAVDDPKKKDKVPGKQLEVEVKFSMKELEKIIEPLINEIKGLKDELESDRKLAKTRYDEFQELESKILL